MSLTQTQESELIHLAQHGSSKESKDAINQLLVEHQPALYQYAMTAVGDHSKAEQAVQNTLIHVWQTLSAGEYVPNPKSENPFRHWLLACCKLNNYQVRQGRVASDRFHYRERAKQRGYDKAMWSSTGEIPSIEQVESRVSAEQDLETAQLVKEIDRLPKRFRAVFHLYTEGYTYKEISEKLGVKPSAVRNYVYHSKRILRSKEGEKHSEPSQTVVGQLP